MEENKEHKSKNETVVYHYNPVIAKEYVEKNFVSKKKIEEKIKELNDYYKKEIYPIKYQWADIDITEFYDSQIELLNELLEDK